MSYDRHGRGEEWLDRIGRFLDLVRGVRVGSLQNAADLWSFQSLSEADRLLRNRLIDQLLDDLGGEYSTYRKRSDL